MGGADDPVVLRALTFKRMLDFIGGDCLFTSLAPVNSHLRKKLEKKTGEKNSNSPHLLGFGDKHFLSSLPTVYFIL